MFTQREDIVENTYFFPETNSEASKPSLISTWAKHLLKTHSREKIKKNKGECL